MAAYALLVLFALATLAIVWLVLPILVAGLNRRLGSIEGTVSRLSANAERERALAARVAKLEQALAERAVQPGGGPGLQARPDAGSAFDAAQARKDPALHPERPAPPPAPLPPPPPAPPRPTPARPADAPVTAPVAAAPTAAAVPVSLAPDAAGDDGWEMRAGTSWFPRLGALIFIVGIALLLKFAIGSTGPLGRVVTGYALSLGMLGGGVMLARRARFATLGYSLVAGGWAGVYFTTYAMHAIDAAHLVDSDVVATLSLFAVAAGMIAHSLYYREQAVTALAYVIAYATLAIAPLSGFSLVASLPLAASMLYVAQRFGWSNVSVLGVVATYGLFAFRRSTGGGGDGETSTLVPYLTLVAYWLSFETADIFGAWRRTSELDRPAPLFVLNAAGFFGASLLQLPHEDPDRLSWYLTLSAAMYLTSAIVRAKLLRRAGAPAAARFDSAHGATGLAAAFVAWAIEVRFGGNRRTIAWLFESEMLVVAGLALRDRFVREMGSIVAVGGAIHLAALMAAGPGASSAVVWTVHPWTMTAAIVAGVWYANQAWLQARGVAPERLEAGYGWTASAIVVGLVAREAAPACQGLAVVALSAALTEIGVRWGLPWRGQAYATGLFGAISVLVYFGLAPRGWTPREAWTVLPATTVLGYAVAARLSALLRDPTLRTEVVPAIVAAGCFATASLALFEWRVLSEAALAPALATTGAVLLGIGHWRRLAGLRWQGYALAAIAAGRASVRLLDAPPDGAADIAGVAIVVALLYVARFLDGSRLSRAAADSTSEVIPAESTARVAMGLAATTTLAMLKWRLASFDLVGPLWAAAGFTMIGLGRWRRITDLRWQGYPLLLLAAVHTTGPILEPGDASSAQVLAELCVIGLLYLSSLVARPSAAETGASTGLRDAEDAVRIAASIAGTLLATTLIFAEVTPSTISLAWAGTGAALFGAGFLAHERVMRLSGVAVLLACIVKLAIYDLRELEAVAQILSYMGVGLLLLGISWVYTRYREQIRRYL